jgi:hypothetical protein
MKAVKTLLLTASFGALLVGTANSRGMNQDPAIPEVNLSPTLSAHLPPPTKASFTWTDSDARPSADSPWRTKLSDESLAWVRRVIRPELLPATPVFRLASIMVRKEEGKPPVEYDGTRMKCPIGGGTLFVTQIKGMLFVLFHPSADPPEGTPSTTQARKAYLEDCVKRIFNHARRCSRWSTRSSSSMLTRSASTWGGCSNRRRR